MRSSLLVPLLIGLCAAPLGAQKLEPGMLVRVERAGSTVQGRVGRLTSDSMVVVRQHRRDARIARGDVRAIYGGHQYSGDENAVFGVLFGVPTGMIAGGITGAAVATPGSGRRAIGGLVGTVAGAVLGGFVGGVIGDQVPMVTWTRMDDAEWPSR